MMGNMWASSRKNLVCLTGETLGETINETKKTAVPLGLRAFFRFCLICLTKKSPFSCFPSDRKIADRDICRDNETSETERIEDYRNCGFLCLTQCLTFPFNVSPATGEGL